MKSMKNLVWLVMAVTLSSGAALLHAEEGDADMYHLKDGSVLFVRTDGVMKMVDKKGEPMTMKEGVPMEVDDGSIIMMRQKHIWKRVGPPGKNPKVLTHE